MATYFMLGKYSSDSIKEISADRTDKTIRLIREIGGEVKKMYTLLGEYDAVLIVELPSIETAMKASLALNILTGISFKTFPAVHVDDFDKMLEGPSKPSKRK